MTPDKISEFQAASVGTLINWANNDWYVAGIDGTTYTLIDSDARLPGVNGGSTLSSAINSNSSQYEPVAMNASLDSWWTQYKTNDDISNALGKQAIADNDLHCDIHLQSNCSNGSFSTENAKMRSNDLKLYVPTFGTLQSLPTAVHSVISNRIVATCTGYSGGMYYWWYIYNGALVQFKNLRVDTSMPTIVAIDLDISKFAAPAPRWLVKHNNTLYHVENGALAAITTTDLTQATFAAYGTEDAPTSEMLVPLANPTIYLCGIVDSEGRVSDPKTIHAAITAYPPAQTLETQIDLSDASIRGIIDAVGEYENGTTVSTSYDGTTWTTPMSLSDWIANTDYNALFNGLGTDKLIHFSFTLDGNATFTRLKVNFNNERS